MAEWIGKTIGKVRIERLLARGGTSEVFLGTHVTLARPVAVKFLHSYIEEEEPILLDRFQREARVVAGLRHPNIVQIFDFDTLEGQPYIVMEYLKGPTLATYLRQLHQRKKRSPHPQIAYLINKLTAALDYAHARGVVHRDIKPGNIMLHHKTDEFPLDQPLPGDVEVVVTDFGLVRLVDAATQATAGILSGTPVYMSPEQALGTAIDRRTDIYSLGIVLYEMLAGHLPFQGDSTLTVLHMHIHAKPLPIPGIPPRVQAVVDRALQKKPEDRHQTAHELADDFCAAIGMTGEVRIPPESKPVVPAMPPPPIEPPVTVPPAPVTLPADILELLTHDNSKVRKLGVQELVGLLDSKNLGLARAAQAKLREIAVTDDSLTLRRIAAEELSTRGFEADRSVAAEMQNEKQVESTRPPQENLAPPAKPVAKPQPPQESPISPVKPPKESLSLPKPPAWKFVLPKFNKRLVGGAIGIVFGLICLAAAGPLIVKGLPIFGSGSPTATLTPPPTTTSIPTLTAGLTQTSSPTSTSTLTATPTQTLTSTPTATRTFVPAQPTKKKRDNGGGGGGQPPPPEP